MAADETASLHGPATTRPASISEGRVVAEPPRRRVRVGAGGSPFKSGLDGRAHFVEARADEDPTPPQSRLSAPGSGSERNETRHRAAGSGNDDFLARLDAFDKP